MIKKHKPARELSLADEIKQPVIFFTIIASENNYIIRIANVVVEELEHKTILKERKIHIYLINKDGMIPKREVKFFISDRFSFEDIKTILLMHIKSSLQKA